MDLIIPRVIPLLTYLLYDNRLTAPLLRSFLRLFAVAWKHDFQHTDPLPFEPQLTQILDLKPTQAHIHLRQLQCANLINWHTDGNQSYVIHFPQVSDADTPQLHKSALPELDDVVNSLNINNINYSQQQHTHSGKAEFRNPVVSATFETASEEKILPFPNPVTSLAKSLDPAADSDDAAAPTESALAASQNQLQTFVLDCLSRAGVWSDVALQIRDQVLANQIAADAHKPNVADVLGWMAYCFGGQHKNGINAPAAVLARNLQSGRRCPENLRPQPICARCRYQHSHCICDQSPQDYFPPDFIEAAFKEQHYDYNTDRWGVCKTCRAFPCQCEESDDD